jgi:hypothetical protein
VRERDRGLISFLDLVAFGNRREEDFPAIQSAIAFFARALPALEVTDPFVAAVLVLYRR